MFDVAPKGEGHQFLGECASEEFGAFEQALFKTVNPGERLAIGQFAADVKSPALLVGSPPADRVEILQREANRVHQVVAYSSKPCLRGAD